MEPCYNEVPWYQNNLLLVTRCIVGTSLQRSIAGQGVIWGGERVEPGEMRWCRQSTLVHLLKSFLEWYERDIERARYCPQDRESVQHEDIWHQNGITEWQHQRHVSRLCYIPSPPLPSPGHRFFLFDPVFCPFPPLRSWFQTIQIWSIRNRENILNEWQCTIWMHMNYEW